MGKRVDYIDLFRGFGILFMIMGHIDFGNIFDYYIHAFHMPMFFFVTGFFFRSKEISTADYIKKKLKALLVPYAAFAAFHSLVYLILYKTFDIRLLYHILLNNSDGMPITGALWFLTALFAVDVFYFLLDKYLADHDVVMGIIILLLVLLGTFIPMLTGYRFPWSLDIALVSIGFCHIGRLIGDQKIPHANDVTGMNLWLSLLLIGGASALVFVNGYVNMRTAQYAFMPLFWLNAVSLIIGYMNLCRIIDSKLSKLPVFDKLIAEFKYIGKNSIVYLCLNQVTILFLRLIIDKLASLLGVQIPYLLTAVFILIMTLVILHLLYVLFDKTKLRVLLGRF